MVYMDITQVEKDIRTKYKRLFDVNYQLREIATQSMAKIIPMTSARHGIVQLFLGKSYKTHKAILLLAQNGYGEDAVILARSLFEMLVNLTYIFAKDNEYRATRYIAYDAVVRQMMYEDSMSIKSTRDLFLERQKDPKPGDESIEVVKKDYLEAVKQYNFDKIGWSGKDMKTLSKLAGRLHDYKTMYNLQCQLSHPSTRGMNDYFTRGKNDLIMNVGPNENYVETVLVMSHDYLYSILEICDGYMKWGILDKLKQSREDCNQELIRINESH